MRDNKNQKRVLGGSIGETTCGADGREMPTVTLRFLVGATVG